MTTAMQTLPQLLLESQQTVSELPKMAPALPAAAVFVVAAVANRVAREDDLVGTDTTNVFAVVVLVLVVALTTDWWRSLRFCRCAQ